MTTVRPDNTAGLPAAGVNIFLYQVTPNPAWQNADLPTRRADGSLLRRPQAAIDLHYLLTFYGEDATLDQQRLLGATLLELHAAPVLSRDVVRQVQNHVPFLNESNLADQIDLVRVTPANLSLEDMNKLWMTFPNVDYVLSIAYVAGVVLIETDDEPPGPALPVLRRRVLAVPFSLAAIDSVQPQPVDLSPPSPTQITLIGSNLDPADAVTFTTPGVTGPLIGTVQPGSGGAPARRHPAGRPPRGRQCGAVDPVRPRAVLATGLAAGPNARDRPVQCGGLRHPARDPLDQAGFAPRSARRRRVAFGRTQPAGLLAAEPARLRDAAGIRPARRRRGPPRPAPSPSTFPASRPARSRPSSSAAWAARSRAVPTWRDSAWTAPRAGWKSIHPGRSAARS